MTSRKDCFKTPPMKQGIIKFSKEFITPTGLKEWAGAEYPVDFETDNIQKAFDYVRSEVENSQKDKHHTQDTPAGDMPVPVIQVQKEEKAAGLYIADIMSCDSLKVLESYKKLIIGNKELTNAYEKRRNEILATGNV